MKNLIRSAATTAFFSFALTSFGVVSHSERTDARSPTEALAFASVTSLPVARHPATSQVPVSEAYGKIPLHFEANRGQADKQVKFLARGSRSTLFLTPSEAVLVFTKGEETAKGRLQGASLRPGEGGQSSRAVVRMTFVGANPEPRVMGTEELSGKANYFIGNDPAKWRTNIPTYAKVRYKDVYPGIDLIYYGNQQQLEYDLVVRPGADPKMIALGFQGADRLEVNTQGDLMLHTAAGAIRQRKPVIYQEVDGARQEISGGYVLKGARQVGFQVVAYDASRPLVIDPALFYSTYLSGSGFGIAVDADGNAYVAGRTGSADFPTTAGAFQTTLSGAADAFVTKLNPTGSALVYSTYLGGSGADANNGIVIAVDAVGNAYVTGDTQSTDFPTTVGAFQTACGGLCNDDAFVTKLNPTGSALVYSTYLGGSGNDVGLGIAVDTAGNAYVTGSAGSADFPTTSGAFQTANNANNSKAFVTKFNPTGTLVFSTYLGGSTSETGYGIAVDAAGNAYVTGVAQSADFPTTAGAFQTTFLGLSAFVTKLNPTGSALVYSTYLGGSSVGQDYGRSIAVDVGGNTYVTGSAGSADFPTTAGAFQTTFGGASSPPSGDAFVTKLNPTGSALVYSTYLGGGGDDLGFGIAVDAAGNAYVTGNTTSTDFPATAGAFQRTLSGGQDVFVTKVNPDGSGLVYSTYLGGSADEFSRAIAVDALPNPNSYIAGYTSSTDFPTTAGAFQTTFGGAFVTKISPNNTPVGTNVSISAGNGVTVTFTAVVSPGETTATTSNSGPTPPAGFTLGTPPTYYDVTTTATYTPPVSVCITYDPAQFGAPDALHLFHFENNAWVDVTTSNDTTNHVICGQVSSFSFFVLAHPSGSALTSLGPAKIWVGLKNSDDVGIRFDLRAEVYRNGTQLAGSGEVASVPGGSSGFNNAKQDTITLTPVGHATFLPGDRVSIKLYVRNACTGSGKNSGTARLWFNDSAANSRFDATIGSPATYYLRDAFALATTPGPGPKKTIDVAAGAKCSPFKTFGTWSTTIN